jgi:hypothetical protein
LKTQRTKRGRRSRKEKGIPELILVMQEERRGKREKGKEKKRRRRSRTKGKWAFQS